MKRTGPILHSITVCILLSFAALSFAQAPARRVALVVGNGAYQANPLRNPPNDADDVASALKDSSFEVFLVKDANLDVLEKAINDFAVKLKGAETGLFYYAGHGVAVDGMNYIKGKVSDGWRYLEAAPSDQSTASSGLTATIST